MKYRYLRFPHFKTKAVTMSFDDGCIHDIHLVEILNRYGMKATFNLPGTEFPQEDTPWKISAERAKTMYFPNGHDVAMHGEQHMALIRAAAKDGIREVMNNRSFLESFYGRIIRGMAYSDHGTTNPEIKGYLKLLGITYARTIMTTGKFDIPTDWLEWNMTVKTSEREKAMELADAFLARDVRKQYQAYQGPMLFAFWGHSFEYYPDTWYQFENLCEKLSGHEDIWYVNNTDLYNYCQAYDSLVFSCDNTMVYNPTHIDVYFETPENKQYLVKAGETLVLE